MNRHEFFALLKCMPRMLAALFTGNEEALDNTFTDVEAIHAQIDARTGRQR